MDHRHRNLLKLKALLYVFELVRGVCIRHFIPDTIGEKLITSWLAKLLCRSPSGIGMSRTFGVHLGMIFTGVLWHVIVTDG
jgi:hypothetical protein